MVSKIWFILVYGSLFVARMYTIQLCFEKTFKKSVFSSCSQTKPLDVCETVSLCNTAILLI